MGRWLALVKNSAYQETAGELIPSLSIANGTLQVNRDGPSLFVRFGDCKWIDPGNGRFAFHQLGNPFFESGNHFPYRCTFVGRTTIQSRQVRHPRPNATAWIGGDIDDAAENRHITWDQ